MGGGGRSGWSWRLAVAVAGLACIVALPWERELQHEFVWDREQLPEAGEQENNSFVRRVVTIPSHGEQLEAWLYLPRGDAAASSGDDGAPPPVLIMAHGMGAQKDIGLWLYAERFVAAGIAVLVFDYRTFGGSTGLPRQWASPKRHLQDYAAVVTHVTTGQLGDLVDPSRVALWGVSLSGGHVLVTAARFRHSGAIKAIVANEPYVSPQAVVDTTRVRGVGRSLRLLAAGLSDELRRFAGELLGAEAAQRLGLKPVYINLVAAINGSTLALLPLQDSEMAARSAARPPRRQGGWKNQVLARVVIEALHYNPAASLKHLRSSPIFVRLARRDHLCPPAVWRSAARRAGLVEGEHFTVQERDTTHIEAHTTGSRPDEIAPAIEFLRRHLGLGGGVPAAAAAAAAAAGGGGEGGGGGEAEPQFPADE